MKRLFKTLKPEYLACRTHGHSWEIIPDIEHTVEYLLGFRETLRCTSCSTIREFVWSPSTGEVMARIYTYPDGYALADYELPADTTLRMAMRVEWSARDRAGDIRTARRKSRAS